MIGSVAEGQGNIVVTGHDDDFHWTLDGITAGPGVQIGAIMTYIRRGSSLPVLVFDHGTQLTGALTALGVPFTRVDPDTASNITDAMFSRTTYSAFAVASDSSCGGCDNDPTGEANIASHSTAIGSFLNAGGGIVGFAGANSSGFYSFLPQTPSSVGGAPSSGYTQTAAGATAGIPAVNGDATHNLFYPPGTNGESASWSVVELNQTSGNGTIAPPAAVTMICNLCTVSGGGLGGGGGTSAVPIHPLTLALLGIGLMAAAYWLLTQQRHA